MSLSGFPRSSTPGLFTSRGAIRGDLAPRELRALLAGQPGQPGIGGFGSFAQFLLRQQGPGFTLPALPKIPKATAPPSRANDPRISAAARRERQIAARRKGRASTNLGGSVGDPAAVRSLFE